MIVKGVEYTIQEIEAISGLSLEALSYKEVEEVLGGKYPDFKVECLRVESDITPDDIEMMNWLGDDYDDGEPVFVVVFS